MRLWAPAVELRFITAGPSALPLPLLVFSPCEAREGRKTVFSMEVPETMLHPPNKIPKLLLPRAKNTYDEAIHPASLSGIGGVNVQWEGLTGKVTR